MLHISHKNSYKLKNHFASLNSKKRNSCRIAFVNKAELLHRANVLKEDDVELIVKIHFKSTDEQVENKFRKS